MSIAFNTRDKRDCETESKSPTLQAAVNSIFYHLIDARNKARVFAAVRECAAGRATAAQHKKLLAERARLIPTFHVFRSLVLEDLREAYIEDRQNKTREAKYRRLAWLTLFRHFAKRNRISQALKIQALDHSGNYACELLDQEAPDQWGKLVKLAAGFGIDEAELMVLYQHAQERSRKHA